MKHGNLARQQVQALAGIATRNRILQNSSHSPRNVVKTLDKVPQLNLLLPLSQTLFNGSGEHPPKFDARLLCEPVPRAQYQDQNPEQSRTVTAVAIYHDGSFSFPETLAIGGSMFNISDMERSQFFN